MNNMDDFFNKRLSDFTTAEDGWNMPSDDVWENVKDQLPKPKKKRRRFIFFLFGVLLLGGISLTASYFISQDKSGSGTDQFAANEIDSDNNTSNLSKTTHPIEAATLISDQEEKVESKIETSDRIDEISAGVDDRQNNLLAGDQKEKLEKNTNKRVSNRPSQLNQASSTLSNSSSAEGRGLEDRGAGNSLSDNTANEAAITGRGHATDDFASDAGSGIMSDNEKQPLSNNQNVGFANEDNATKGIVRQGGLQLRESVKEEPILIYKSEHEGMLGALPFQTFNTDRDKLLADDYLSLEKLIMINDLDRKPQEIGISHSLSAFTFIKSQTELEDMDRFSIGTKFKNLNLEYGRWLSEKWRFSTGIYLTKIEVDLDFLQFFNFDQPFMNESITTEYGNTVSNSSANSAGNVRLTFFPGQEPTEGELINIRGNINVALSALQVPLLFSRHRRKNKIEFFYGGGAVFELLREEQSDGMLDVYREDQIISSSSEIDDLDEVYLDYSVYVIGGFRHHITNRVSAGINFKIYGTELIFSTADVGVYYRW